MDSIGTETISADRKSTQKRAYSRAELFRLAKSTLCNNEDEPFMELLSHLKDYKAFELYSDGDCLFDHDSVDLHDSGPRSLMNFGRQTSVLSGEFGRNFNTIPVPMERQQAASFGQRKIFRMTSSPLIRRSNQRSQNTTGSTTMENLSPQVRAKYARLIETLSNQTDSTPNGTSCVDEKPAASLQEKSSPKYGATSCEQSNGDFRNFKRQQAIGVEERPSQLFGPLRHHNERRNSDEPRSLPHSVNYGFGPRVLPTKASRFCGNRLSKLEDSDETPVKRISAQSEATEMGADLSESLEDDDFDITKLLSITILSDIKTIRHEPKSQPISRQSSASFSPKSPPNNQRVEQKSNELNSRLPTRSRTALDFRYNERNNRSNFYQFAPNRNLPPQSNQTSALNFDGPRNYGHQNSCNLELSSLPYSWTPHMQFSGSENLYNKEIGHLASPQISQFGRANGPTKSIDKSGNTNKDKQHHVDKETASIIETFKAQVRARAEGLAVAPEEQQSQCVGPDEGEKKTQQRQPEQQDSARVKVENSSETEKEKVGTVEESEVKLDETLSQKKKVEETSPLATTTSGQPITSSSNIPRLITLHRSKFSLTTSDTIPAERGSKVEQKEKTDEKVEQIGGNTQAANSRANIKMGSKFVSRYKELRGKSLADELSQLDEM